MDLRRWLLHRQPNLVLVCSTGPHVYYVGRYFFKRLFSEWAEFNSNVARVVTYGVIGHEYVVLDGVFSYVKDYWKYYQYLVPYY